MTDMQDKEKTNENKVLKGEITQLRQAEEKLDLLAHALRSVSECVSITDMEDIILFVNDAFLKTYGYEEDELFNKPIDVIRSPNNPIEVVKEILPATLRGGWQGEILNRRKDGADFPIALSTSVIRNEEGQPIALIGVANDISERKRAEEALRRQNEYFAALHDTTLGLITRLDLNNLLEALVIRAGQLLDTPHGYIYLIDPFTLSKDEVEGVELERKVGVGVFNQSANPRLKLGEGLAGKVWQSGQPLEVNDYGNWSGRSPNVRYNVVIRALMGVPLTQSTSKDENGPQVVGVLGMAYGTETNRNFGDEEVELLSRFAQLASIALDNARLFDAETRQRQISESLSQVAMTLNATLDRDTVLTKIMEQLGQVIQYEGASIFLKDGDELVIVRGTSLAASFIGFRVSLNSNDPTVQVFNARQPKIITDVRTDPDWELWEDGQDIRAWMGAPLLMGKQAMGVLTVDNFEVNAYRQKDAEILQIFANQAAIAIRNAQLFETEQHQRQMAESLGQVAAVLNANLELDTLLEEIMVQLRNVVEYDSAGILLKDRDGLLISGGTGSFDFDSIGHHIPLNGSEPASLVFMNQRPLVMPDVQKDPNWVPVPGAERIRGWMGIPLLTGEKSIGVLTIDSFTVGTFNEKHAEIVQAFANQAAIAIENAQLLKAEQEQRELAEILRQATTGLISVIGVERVLDNILFQLEQVVPYDSACIFLFRGDMQRAVAGRGFPNLEEVVGKDYSSDDLLTAEILETRQPLCIKDTQTDGRMKGWGETSAVRSWMGVPMIVRENIIGYMTLDSYQVATYADEEAALAQTFANHAAIALDNARLFEEMQKAKEAAEATSKELSQTLAELRRTQGQLVEAEKMAALGGLVAGVAHEINTPVGVGVTAASLLEDKTTAFKETYQSGQMKRSDLEKYLDTASQSSSMILNNLNRAAELIQSFKQVAVDQSSEERRSFLVKAYLEEILLSLRPKLKKSQLTVEIKCNDNIILESYPGVFSQIVTNLVMNSLVHAYEAEDKGCLTFELKQKDSRFIFEYGDDGKGIQKENLSKIFEPFFTTKRTQGGSGLGLHIIYNLVTQRLGGTILCESEVGSGTRFVIEVPVS